MFIEMRGYIRIKIEESAPSSPDADDFVTFVRRAIDGSFDAWVKSGDVSAPCKYSNIHAES
jgi:hypothetical protein